MKINVYGKEIPSSWIGRVSIIKMTTLQAIKRLVEIPVKMPMTFSAEMEKLSLKFI